MKNEFPLYSLRNFKLEIVISESKKNIVEMLPVDEDHIRYHLMPEKRIISELSSNIFSNIESYYVSFGNVPQNGTFMANEMNLPLYITSTFVNGQESNIIIVCHLAPKQDNRLYSVKFQN